MKYLTIALLAASVATPAKVEVPQAGALNCHVEIAKRDHSDGYSNQIIWLKCEGYSLELQGVDLGKDITLQVQPGGSADELWLRPYVALPMNFRVIAKD